ncbi:uncharacterized protein [Nicotiana sylvestris]|uniref:uncharacterized protein n=1 Tax=Nicotiana sylvestris TaxID=4096 RepID=UPI00388CA8D5
MEGHIFVTRHSILYLASMISLTKWKLPITHKASGQVEVFNREIKSNLSKTVNANRTDWSKKLDDALWAYKSAYKIPIGLFPYRLVFQKSCHLPMELEHKAMWALNKLNLDWDVATNLQVNELDEFWYHAYESLSLYKEKMKYLHDMYIWNKEFKAGDLVLLFTKIENVYREAQVKVERSI